ncbi:MAG TPA: carboxypeptidase-like regulatory domain-containing protein [Nitrospiraceae bacterium]|nr:carboxypeptidase-like regulatory domain-containing protein [Nitrospiraceae bacterium]
MLLESETARPGTKSRAQNRLRGFRGWRKISGGPVQWLLAALGLVVFFLPSILFATHEADHRFTVEGFVCDKDGKPSSQVEVLVKDTRVTIGQTVRTDSDGYYKVTLHLHNDNLGDPLLVEAGTEQKRYTVQFDPKDLESERHLQANFGSGCEQDLGPPRWLVYGLIVGAVAGGGLIGLKIFKRWKRKEQRRRKGPSKRQK